MSRLILVATALLSSLLSLTPAHGDGPVLSLTAFAAQYGVESSSAKAAGIPADRVPYDHYRMVASATHTATAAAAVAATGAPRPIFEPGLDEAEGEKPNAAATRTTLILNSKPEPIGKRAEIKDSAVRGFRMPAWIWAIAMPVGAGVILLGALGVWLWRRNRDADGIPPLAVATVLQYRQMEIDAARPATRPAGKKAA